ncbi:MAG: hypothetical protein H6656_06105 [Ardenticatenaceae bacterium]|nr:hypothetical protein [Ardenticatenaceae bacterium]
MQHKNALPLLQILVKVNKYSVLAPPQEVVAETGDEMDDRLSLASSKRIMGRQ